MTAESRELEPLRPDAIGYSAIRAVGRNGACRQYTAVEFTRGWAR